MSTTDHRTPIPPIAGLFGVAAAGYMLPGLAAAVPALRAPLGIEDAVAGGRGYALTFDDGPHAQGTPAVLDVLAAAGVRATFFLVGEQVERAPALAAEIAAAGHEIALHGHRHRLLLRRTPQGLADDLDRAVEAIGAASGRTPVCYRPPYGVFSAAGLVLARRRGWLPLLWSKWGRDWDANATPAGIAARATAGLARGDVVLLHDADHYSVRGSWRQTVAALPSVLESVERLGLRCVRADA